jgi:hypothetical protein
LEGDARAGARRDFSLRAFAWRRTPIPGKGPVKTREAFDCARDCQRDDGTWIDERRSARGCRRVDLPVVRFAPTGLALYQHVQGMAGSAYIGRYPDKRLHGQKYLGVGFTWKKPFDPPEAGCPGAYYHGSPYIRSLAPYLRHRDRNGGRVPNPLFEGASRTIQLHVLTYEHHEERAIAYAEQVADDRLEEKLKAAEQERQRQRQKGRR